MPEDRATKASATKQRNRKKYKKYTFRVRRDSELVQRLDAFAERGNTSVNFLITKAICKHLKCPLPHWQYETYTRRRIL